MNEASQKVEKTNNRLFGQWIGQFKGDPQTPGAPNFVFPGQATFNIEFDRPDIGFACIDQGNQIHGSRKDFKINVNGTRITGNLTSTYAYDWKTNETISTEESIRRQNNTVFYLTETEIVDGFIDQKRISCKWAGRGQSHKLSGTFEGHRLGQCEPSPPDESMSWEQFKDFVAKQIQDRHEFFFRGQCSNKYRLVTSFHRERRYDLIRYDREACEKLAQWINATSTRQYDRHKSTDYGPLLSLAQHHGFPTPLLDWSKSPYIAAFFALENRSMIHAADDNPRIYVFNSKMWQQETTQSWHIADPRPVITPLEFPPHNNPRHLPQQSVHTYTNVEDPEAWIRLKEKEKSKRYLTIIDIPRSEREFAMRDLAYMGVTAATLYPGLDGVCRSLKEEYFRLVN